MGLVDPKYLDQGAGEDILLETSLTNFSLAQQASLQQVAADNLLCANINDMLVNDANSIEQSMMKTDTKSGTYNPYDGKPGDPSDSNYSTEIQQWQTTYNQVSEEWDNATKGVSTAVQTSSSTMSTISSNVQNDNVNYSSLSQKQNTISNLLQSQL